MTTISTLTSMLVFVLIVVLFLAAIRGAAYLILKGSYIVFVVGIFVFPVFLLGYIGNGTEGSPWANGYRLVGFWGRIRQVEDKTTVDAADTTAIAKA